MFPPWKLTVKIMRESLKDQEEGRNEEEEEEEGRNEEEEEEEEEGSGNGCLFCKEN